MPEEINFDDLGSRNRESIRLSQNDIFKLLESEHDYWGSNSIIEMKDFCKRNQLVWIIKPLENLELIN